MDSCGGAATGTRRPGCAVRGRLPPPHPGRLGAARPTGGRRSDDRAARAMARAALPGGPPAGAQLAVRAAFRAAVRAAGPPRLLTPGCAGWLPAAGDLTAG